MPAQPSLQDLLAQLGGAPSGSGLSPDFLAQLGIAPAASPAAPAMADPSATASPPMAATPPAAQPPADALAAIPGAQGAGQPPSPPPNPLSALPKLAQPSILDWLVYGPRARSAVAQNQADTIDAQRRIAMGQFNQQALQEAYSRASPDARAAIAFNSAKYGETLAARLNTPVTLGADQREVVDGKTVNAAPGTYSLDAGSGRPFNNMTGDARASLGGGFKNDGGNITSERTGEWAGSIPTFQKVGSAEKGDFRLPPGAPAPNGAPGQGAAGIIALASGQSATQGGGASGQAPTVSPTDAAYLGALRRIESGGNDAAQKGSSTGRYQFKPQTFAAMGGTNISDPAQQDAAALKYRGANAQELESAGIPATASNLYLAHQQGAAGAKALLGADPSANAVAVLQGSGLYKNSAEARRAITGNGGRADISVGEFTGMWSRRFNKALQRAGGSPGAGQSSTTAPQAAAPAAPGAGTVPNDMSAPLVGPRAQLLSPAELAAAGFAPGTVAVRTPTGDVEVKQKPQEAGKNTTGDLSRVQTLRKQADDAHRVAGMAQDFMALNRKNGTGPIYSDVDVSLPFMHHEMQLNPSHFLARASNPDFAAMESLTSRAAPLLRPEGSGRIMQNEYANFLQSFPNVRNRGDANDRIAAQLQSEAESRRDYANFMAGWLQTHGTLTGADQAFSTQQASRKAAAAAAPKMLTYNPKTGALE